MDRRTGQPGRKGKASAPIKQPDHQAKAKFGGDMVAPQLMGDENDIVIDPNLLVGPLYVPKTTKTDRIKEQLGDITEKLAKTLYTFDEVDEYEPAEDPVFSRMKEKLGAIDDANMRSDMAQFMTRYEGMSEELTSANRDRDEMLHELADWFTTDHVDLDDIKLSIDDNEEEDIKSSYYETVTNFEKLRNLRGQIQSTKDAGKPIWPLKKKQVEIQRAVVDKFKMMKDMSIQTKKAANAAAGDDAHWRYAAQEIVDMLNSVRTENDTAMGAVKAKMNDLMKEVEQQTITNKSLNRELRDKKEVVKKLTDENSDLTSDMTILQAKFNRYEKELKEAQKLIKKLHSTRLVEKDYGGATEETSQLAKSISKVIVQLEKSDPMVPKQMGSDTALLRTQIREYKGALENLKNEFAVATKELEEKTTEIDEKSACIEKIEKENEKMKKELTRLRKERRKAMQPAQQPVAPPEDVAHKCEHCKCNLTDTDWELEISQLKKDVEKQKERCAEFKKSLADTELKLSDAYREISELRREIDRTPPPPPPVSAPLSKPKPASPKGSLKREPKKDMKTVDTDRPKSATKVPKVVQPKPRKEVKSRYLQNHTKQERLPAVPNVMEMSAFERTVEAEIGGVSAEQGRELKLYKAGDLQGKLNALLVEIMEFVTDIGKMIYTEKDDDSAKIQSMKAFSFGHDTQNTKRAKDIKDQSMEEMRQKKSQVIFSGQHACSQLKEAFEILSKSLNLQHDEYEAIYRSFKISQQRTMIRKEVFMGHLPFSALQEFDREQLKRAQEMSGSQKNMLSAYLGISYGGSQSQAPSRMQTRNTPAFHGRESTDPWQDGDESKAKLRNGAVHMLSMQRSKSDLDTRDSGTSLNSPHLMGGGGIMKERSPFFYNGPGSNDVGGRDSGTMVGNKQEMRIGVAMVPRKGLISLSTNDNLQPQMQLNVSHDNRRQAATQEHNGKHKSKSLIRRNDILGHIKAGAKLLEDAEEQKQQEEEMAKSLGDYTINDLQSKILEMTDAKSLSRRSGQHISSSSSDKLQSKSSEKTMVLPAIKNFNPFSMKT